MNDTLHNSPWGAVQHQIHIAPGIVKVDTASHGGYWISDERRAQMPPQWARVPTFAGGNWYEEDCDWCLVALSFRQYFPEDCIEAAMDTLRWLVKHSDRFSAYPQR